MEIWVFLPMLLFLGAMTAYEDIKKGLIRNKWIVLGLAYTVVANIALFGYFMYIGQAIRPAYFLELAATVLISLVVGFIMWTVGLWTAGDAKLFTAFSALVPLSIYQKGHLPYFDSANILLNTFVPFFIVYTGIMLYKTTWRQKLHYLLQSLEPKQLGSLFLFLFAFTWPLSYVFETFRLPANFFTAIAFLFIVLVVLERVFSRNLLYLMIGIGILRTFFDPSLSGLDAWLMIGLAFVSFIFLRLFILYMGYDTMTKQVDIKLVKPGMVPAETVYMEGKQYRKQKILHFSMLSYLQESARKRDYLYEPAAEGLTEHDVKKLHKLEKKLGFEHLRVYKTLSFAPYLTAGMLLTLIFKGNMFIALLA